MSYNNEWGTETGLLDEFEATVDAAYFGTDERYMEGTVPMLHLELFNIEADADNVPDTIIEKFSVGNGWEVIEGGAAVARIDGNERRKFNNRSKYGMVIDAVMKNEDGAFDGLFEVLAERGSPKTAGIWKGLRFKFERIDVYYGEKIGTKQVLLPVEFVGVDGEAPSTNGNGNGQAIDTEALRATLEALASGADTYDDFVGAALAVPGVNESNELLDLVGDTSFYESVKA